MISFNGVIPPVTLDIWVIAIILVLFVISFLISSTCISRFSLVFANFITAFFFISQIMPWNII